MVFVGATAVGLRIYWIIGHVILAEVLHVGELPLACAEYLCPMKPLRCMYANLTLGLVSVQVESRRLSSLLTVFGVATSPPGSIQFRYWQQCRLLTDLYAFAESGLRRTPGRTRVQHFSLVDGRLVDSAPHFVIRLEEAFFQYLHH